MSISFDMSVCPPVREVLMATLKSAEGIRK
jgi:hypothetical protein